MRRAAALLLLALAACGQPDPEPPPPAVSFREAGSLIGSTTRGSLADLDGDWVIAKSFPGTPWAAPGTRLTLERRPQDALTLRFAGPSGVREVIVAAVGPGRLAPAEGPELWVLWVDDDFRTAAVGTPDGTFGWIMDRPGEASPDRWVAAREMLDFNGYDVTQLAG